MESLVFLLMIFAMGYFLVVRPQNKRQQERQQTLGALRVGDDVVTVGGLHGRVEALTETTVDLAIAEDESGDPMLLRFDKVAIGRVVPADAADDDSDVSDDSDDELLADDAVITDDLSTATLDVSDADATSDRD